jgi:hypothetical protein
MTTFGKAVALHAFGLFLPPGYDSFDLALPDIDPHAVQAAPAPTAAVPADVTVREEAWVVSVVPLAVIDRACGGGM